MRFTYENSVLICVAILAIFGAVSIPQTSSDSWAGSIPLGAGIILFVLSVLLLVKKTPPKISKKSKHRLIMGVFGLSVLYYQLIVWFGYILPTAFMSPVMLYIFGVRNTAGLVGSSILCPIIFYVIFFVVLGVYPPYGTVFDILSKIQG